MHYFPAKDDVISAIIPPVLERVCARLDDLSKLSARRAVEQIVALYLSPSAEFPDALRVPYAMQSGACARSVPEWTRCTVTLWHRSSASSIAEPS